MMFNDDDAPEATFPLLGLPDQVIRDVIDCMDPREVIGFSLISNKTALLVQSVNNTSLPPDVEVTSTVEVSVQNSYDIHGLYYFRFYDSEQLPFGGTSTQPLKELYPPGYVRVYWNANELGKFEKKEFTLRNWMDHISKIFNQPKINSLEYKPKVFSAQSVKETFPEFDEFVMLCCAEEYERMMKIFNYSKSIQVVGGRSYLNKESEAIPKVFIQNWERAETEIHLKISLDDLLICNAQSLTISELYVTNKGLNTFLKCWMKGACPNLKHAKLRAFTDKKLDLDIVWKGIKRQNAPENRTNWCRTCKYWDFMAFDGGVNIKRNDGTVATILIEVIHPYEGCFLKMFVQH
ncbi:hypothetical protein CAEBREN_02105 [Caenorhabditis brenneri]|uniref:F-box domain-containing protein n=1 Tax=Caenorhabditis brenneri TaxID=135651 RepID=G0MC53_CAEBE|nr:hypothetical protein CAEBREN_02105 [Caenorhabditis brenneri]